MMMRMVMVTILVMMMMISSRDVSHNDTSKDFILKYMFISHKESIDQWSSLVRKDCHKPEDNHDDGE